MLGALVGDARGATERFGLAESETSESWPGGFRFAAGGFQLCVVVLSELDDSRATLPLRLLGRGKTLRRATEQLRQLPEQDPMRGAALAVLVQRRFAALHWEDASNVEAEMGFMEEFREFQQRTFDEGHDRGVDEGRRGEALALVSRLLVRKFGPLGPDTRARLEAVSVDQLEVFAERVIDAADLEAVLAEP